jgi:hypothetical protein
MLGSRLATAVARAGRTRRKCTFETWRRRCEHARSAVARSTMRTLRSSVSGAKRDVRVCRCPVFRRTDAPARSSGATSSTSRIRVPTTPALRRKKAYF